VNALVERVRTRLAEQGAQPTAEAVAEAVRAESGGVASDLDVLAALHTVRQELVGAGPLDPLLRDPATTDVLVSAGGAVTVDRGAGLEPAAVRLPGEDSVRRLAQRLALAAGRRLDDASPCVDGFLPGALDGARGVRLHAVLAPVAADGTCLSLRVLRPAAHDLPALAASGTLVGAAEPLLRAIVAARLAVLVSGGTGSGKTTLLAALLGVVDPRERILTVEDAQELQPRHPQVVRLVARPPNIEGAGAISLRDLLRQALRMRPDRLVVGEVRGAEVAELLTALNTGHDGGAGTVHANSAREVPARMEALAALGGMERAALHSQLAAAVQVVLHMRRGPRGRVLEAVGVLRREPGGVEVLPVWERAAGWTGHRPRIEALLAERGIRVPWDEPTAPARTREPSRLPAAGGRGVLPWQDRPAIPARGTPPAERPEPASSTALPTLHTRSSGEPPSSGSHAPAQPLRTQSCGVASATESQSRHAAAGTEGRPAGVADADSPVAVGVGIGRSAAAHPPPPARPAPGVPPRATVSRGAATPNTASARGGESPPQPVDAPTRRGGRS
jgi:pilus assembly protein CpaF